MTALSDAQRGSSVGEPDICDRALLMALKEELRLVTHRPEAHAPLLALLGEAVGRERGVPLSLKVALRVEHVRPECPCIRLAQCLVRRRRQLLRVLRQVHRDIRIFGVSVCLRLSFAEIRLSKID